MPHIQSLSSIVSFDAADSTAEVTEMRDLATFHEQLMNNSPTYAARVWQATELGPINVNVSHLHQDGGAASWDEDKKRHQIDINPAADVTEEVEHKSQEDRRDDARLALIFEIQNTASLSEFNQVDEAARRGDFSALAQNFASGEQALARNANDGAAVAYSRRIEEIEFSNTQMVNAIVAEMTSNGLVCWNRELPEWNNFATYYSDCIDNGHAKHYLEAYDDLAAQHNRASPVVPPPGALGGASHSSSRSSSRDSSQSSTSETGGPPQPGEEHLRPPQTQGKGLRH